jgi:hypothetical protein
MTTQPLSDDMDARLAAARAKATRGDWQLQDACSWRRIGTAFHDHHAEQAAEIQRLREALAHIRDAKAAFNAHPVGVIATLQDWARTALNGKDGDQ